MKAPALALYLTLSACMHSEHYGDYHYSSTIHHGAGQTITQSDHAHWQGGGYTPPQASLHYQNGNTAVHVRTPQPAPAPPAAYVYPVYPQAAPPAPYVRSEQTLLPTCTQQRTVRHGGQTYIIQQPCS